MDSDPDGKQPHRGQPPAADPEPDLNAPWTKEKLQRLRDYQVMHHAGAHHFNPDRCEVCFLLQLLDDVDAELNRVQAAVGKALSQAEAKEPPAKPCIKCGTADKACLKEVDDGGENCCGRCEETSGYTHRETS